jgi:hypothetical protein
LLHILEHPIELVENLTETPGSREPLLLTPRGHPRTAATLLGARHLLARTARLGPPRLSFPILTPLVFLLPSHPITSWN